MFGWLNKKPVEAGYPLAELREALFGDRALQEWGAKHNDAEPWSHFASGLHFGQAPFEAFTGDPMAAPIIGAAMQLMQGLIYETQPRG